MKDPVKIGECTIDRAAIQAVVPQDGRLLIFMRSGRPINIENTLSKEELEELTAKTI